ncbi:MULTISPECIES: four-carbon acid sugar kinase family protein [unclassified Microcoleus]|uniref:four-carbon acid sugar kinase family protein n=1 Tax=unclassified Microcoleus TaxID=2642155 RepID=UPI001D305CC9|nr:MULTISPECIES: four-carbon acid sugar kinase family protein [unclassified Microcoleus]MCC3419117.1 four-carbon acid sugar kinase family protein [Microcoleus sp. PH2017_07_MST_O_A]MCC3432400.1 four-carbon acid sugar kinase family protein [Microcoleus sp. PH2017_04_SCI_O_A]MCC3443703.1 four-carbon acid sugar kinase family protein [Microcoleus sp. PH2017_03_ELD_O_A]MCC3507071.1 four-carbon acid sugar kinase family protein [Microcoleus sp. PH2017_19_SFW_U_A]TAF91992.1 MAG: four-carbon acid sugar
MSSTKPKIIVLDDDPTGSQTVHSCLLLTRWDEETLRLGLRDKSPIFFILTNTRSLTPETAASVTREVCQNLKRAIAIEEIEDFLIVSRSDSTLRGHYPIETDVIAEELGPFDAHFLIPAFFEGGRITRNSVHYLMVNGVETPVHETEFAKDSVFGYHHSYLPDYVEEKTQGRIHADTVDRILLADIRYGSLDRLMEMTDNQCAVVDGESQGDLNTFAKHILDVVSQGKKFLFRSGASILTSLADLGPQPIAADEMAEYVKDGKPGAVIVGSHVKKTTDQLERLLEEPNTASIEVDVSHLVEDSPESRAQILNEILEKVRTAHADSKTPVIYTSRQELEFENAEVRLKFGAAVSALLMDVVRGLPADIGFLISKGGITSNDVLSTGLSLKSIRQIGQIIPGCSVVKTEPDHPLFPDLPVVLFPGNVGDSNALATAYKRLSKHSS